MRFIPSRPSAWTLAIALVIGAPLAQAATNTSSVVITSFSATTSAGTLTWSDPYQSFSANALDAGGLLGADSDVFDMDDWGLAIAGASTVRSIAAASTTTPQTFITSASSTSSFGNATNLPNEADTRVLQSGSFKLSQAATVTFNIGYTLAVSALGGNAVTDYGLSTLAFDLGGVSSQPNAVIGGGQLSDQLASFAQAAGAGSRNGTFSLTLTLGAGDTGFYTLQGGALAFATASLVPEPAGWLMLAGGLAALSLRRRLAT